MNFVAFVNKMQMTSFGALVNQVIGAWVVIFFSFVARDLLLGSTELRQGYGFQIASLIVGYAFGKIVANAVSNGHNRETARENQGNIEAKERGKATGAAQALALATAATELKTQEHPAMQGIARDQSTMNIPVDDTHPTTPTAPVSDGEVHEWATGDPQRGVL